jgi:two-component system OmpR family sensor kinase
MARAMAADTMEQEPRPGLRDNKQLPPFGVFRRLSDRTPLRTKLITAVLALVILALAVSSVASVVVQRRYATTQHDADIVGTMQFVDNFVDSNGGHLPTNVDYGYATPTKSNIVIGLQQPGTQLSWDPRNNLPGLSNNDPLPALPTNGTWTGSANGDTAAVFSVRAQSGPDTWRVMAQTVTLTSTGQPAILVVAEDLGNINALTGRIVLFDLIVGGVIVLVLAVVGVAVVQANLKPLNDIELTAGQIASGHLDHRVPEGDPRTEIGSLGRSLNAMLTQIERAFHARGEAEKAAHQSEERMRRFIADAAHELRTPLTTIRGFAAHYRLRGGASRLRPGPLGTDGGKDQDLAFRTVPGLTGPASGAATAEGLSPEDLDRLMSRVESEATRMGMLVEDLLTLARLDQQRPLNIAPVDLLMLAADAVQDARIVQPGRPVDLIVAPGTAFLIDGDEPRLRQVITNLVNNAITHTPAGTPVRVKIARGTLDSRRAAPAGQPGELAEPGAADGTVRPAELWGNGTGLTGIHQSAVPAVVIDVEDDGPGMTHEQAQRVFERFYRADAARNRASGGTGLGLAIVAGLVSAHGGTVSVRTATGRGADFQVKLPLSPDALASDEPEAEAEDYLA